MPSDTFCRWLPDTEVVEDFVHDFLLASRLLHGRHPDTLELMQPGVELPEIAIKNSVGFSLLCNYFPPYRVILSAGEPQSVTCKPLDPLVEEFKLFIENNGEVFAGFNEMFDQAPKPADLQKRKVDIYIYRLFPSMLIYCVDRKLRGLDEHVQHPSWRAPHVCRGRDRHGRWCSVLWNSRALLQYPCWLQYVHSSRG